ncbi:MAG TPA: PqqD family peptide modification chaperone [Acidiferrobacteraceae bacterium]|nr:PqqD family peptide modification chaperone [Acidiferrobacteraceae bacterium]HEX19649.1 PqqD family peptide modification chaperone [Acidiferrobacteraceae bacterium]
MSTSIFSDSWHRVRDLAPILRKHTKIYRHHYRGELWYVLQDRLSGKTHRFTPTAHYMIDLMDGKRSVQEIWDIAMESLGDDAPTQDELIQLISQLHTADALQTNLAPDTKELLERHKKLKRQNLFQRFLNPLALRIPLVDPEKFLNIILPYVRPLCGWMGMVIWSVVVFIALALAILNWPQLTENMADRVLATQSLIVLALLFPVIKIFHELGHAIAVKIWGGEVHEMGIMMLVLMPVPYVDASAASSFRNKRKRIIVGSGGMMAELFIAGIALFVWLNVEPGLIHVIAYNTMLIASVSTLLFNANPLLRFDGYYILGDIIEIPNLGSRSNRYLGYLCKKYLFGVSKAKHEQTTQGERIWFVFYSIASFIYRMFIAFFIAMFVASKFFFIGALLAIWSIVMMLIVPAIKTGSKLFTDFGLKRNRKRVVGVSIGTLGLVLLLTVVIPVPYWTTSQGIIWVPGDSLVRAGTDCYINKVLHENNTYVVKGTPLVECRSKELETKVTALKARMDEVEALHTSEVVNNKARANETIKEIENVRAQLNDAQTEASKLTVRAQSNGRLILPNDKDMIGKFVRKGELLGYTLSEGQVTVRVAVSQYDIDLIRNRTKGVEMRLAGNIPKVLQAKVKQFTPSATDELPSAALTVEGGGEIAINPSATETVKAFEKYFIVDLDLPKEAKIPFLGSRVYVKFIHSYAPLGAQWYRSLRQLLLTQLNV